jgi:GNAT superfamily N-acetyltransferase
LYRDDDADACAAVLASLPEWFGIPEAVAEYLDSLKSLPSFVAEGDAGLLGLYSLADSTHDAGELHLIAVHRGHHGRGVGHALVEHAVRQLQRHGKSLMYVLTVDAAHPNEHYARTRRFYERVGFKPLLASSTLLNPGLPALLLVRQV